MTAPAYTTDLTTLNTGEATTGWTEPGTWLAGGTPVAETDYFIQGTGCISKTFNATGAGGLVYTAGAAATIPTDGAFLAWQYFGAPNAIATEANGGIRLIIGSSTTAFKGYNLGGSDTYEYGGWQCLAADPSLAADVTVGSPTTSYTTFGWAANLVNAVSKGNPFGCDALRYGRCEMRINGGDVTNGYATFAGFAAQNDAVANRWGLFQKINGGYQWQGLMTLGYGSAVDFRDSNRSIVVANTKKVSANFNKIEIRNTASRVDWIGISIQALGTVSKGKLEVIDDATVNFTSCTFTDMSTFVLKATCSIVSTIFRRCELVTQGGAAMQNCTFDAPTQTGLLSTVGAIGNVSNSTFVSKGTGHAIEITGAAGTCTLSGLKFTGFAASNGSTGNEAVFVNIASGTVTINITGGGNAPSIRTAGATVNVVSGATVTFTGLPVGCDIVILQAGTSTILQQVDQNGTTSYSWGYNGTPTVDVGFIKPGYQPRYIRNLTLGSSDSSIPVSLTADRNYL